MWRKFIESLFRNRTNVIMKKLGLFIFIATLWFQASAQVALDANSVNSSAALELNSTTKGLLMPRLSQSQMMAISSPATGLQVVNTDANCIYYFNGSQWQSALNSHKVYANAGVSVQFDNLIVRIPTSGNRSLQLRTVSGTSSMSGVANNFYISTSTGGGSGLASSLTGFNRQSSSFGTTFTYWESGLNFSFHGSYQEIFLVDESNSRSYRILCIIGNGYNDNYFEIERLK